MASPELGSTERAGAAPEDDRTHFARELARAHELSARLEERCASLVTLYVAAFTLKASPTRGPVIEAIRDVLVNLVGCEQFGIYERAGDRLRLIGEMPGCPAPVREVPLESPMLQAALHAGGPWLRGTRPHLAAIPEAVTAVVPFTVEASLTGAVLLFTLLPQKSGTFAAVDVDLLKLLATHAAPALFLSRADCRG